MSRQSGKIFLPEKRMQSNDLYLQQLALVILYVGVEIMFYLTQCMHTRVYTELVNFCEMSIVFTK